MSLSELYIGCRTYRRFKQDPIPAEDLHQILENARISSCARNGQVLRFYAVVSAEKLAAMQTYVKWAGALPPELGQPKAGELPVAFVVIAKPVGEGGFTDVDVGIAANTITTSAWDLGFGSCMLGALNIAKINELLDIPEGYTARLAVALGKPDHRSTIVPVPENGKLTYYVDENVDYYVPKKAFDEVVIYK